MAALPDCACSVLDEVIPQLGHLLVILRICELIADYSLADVVDDPFRNRVPRQLALRVEPCCNGIVDTGLNDKLGQRHFAQCTHISCRVRLNVGIE